MNRIYLFLTLFILSFPCFSANRYVIPAGGNSNTTATWSATSGGAGGASIPTSSDDVFLDASSGQLTINADLSCRSMDCTGYTNTLTHKSFSLKMYGNLTFSTGMNYDCSYPNAALITFQSDSTFLSRGKLVYKVETVYSTSGTDIVLGDNLKFIARSGISFVMWYGSLDLNGKTLSGADANLNRLLIVSATYEVGKRIYINGGTFENCDFRDINFSSPSNLDLSGIVGGSGDCGGNAIIGGGTVLTLTPATTQVCTMSTNKNYSNPTIWTSRVPLPQDNVSMAGVTGGVLSGDLPRLGNDIDWTGATGNPGFSLNSTPNTIGGSLTFIDEMTFSNSGVLSFISKRRSGNHYITSCGKTFVTPCYFVPLSSTYILNDAHLSTGTSNSTFLAGTGIIDFNNNSFTCDRISLSAAYPTLELKLRNSSFFLGGTTTNTPWDGTAVGYTVTPGNSNIVINTIGNTKSFKGAGRSFNNIAFSGDGTGSAIISGDNSFNNININPSKTVSLTSGTTQTVQSFTAQGTSANPITINSSTEGSPATLSDSSGMNNLYYCNIKDITVTGGAVWNAYTINGNTNTSGNSGWSWGPTFDALMMIMD